MTRYEVTACVLVCRRDHDADRWLLGVRRGDVGYAPGLIGLIGGHVEVDDGPADALEHAARREALEEAGIDLSGVPLHYVASLRYPGVAGRPSIDVTYAADAPVGVRAQSAAPAELTAVDWWSAAELAADPRHPAWLPAVLNAADGVLTRARP